MVRWTVLVSLLAGCDEIEPFYDDSETRACDPRTAWYADADADAFGDPMHVYIGCAQPAGFVADNTDCDDSDLGIHSDCPPADTATNTNMDTGDTASDTAVDTGDTSAGSGDTSSDTGEASDADSGDSGA